MVRPLLSKAYTPHRAIRSTCDRIITRSHQPCKMSFDTFFFRIVITQLFFCFVFVFCSSFSSGYFLPSDLSFKGSWVWDNSLSQVWEFCLLNSTSNTSGNWVSLFAGKVDWGYHIICTWYATNICGWTRDDVVAAAMDKTGKPCCLVHAAARGRTCTFTLKVVSTLIQTAHVTIDLRSRHGRNPRPTRFVSGKANERRWHRKYQVDTWPRRREVARGVLRSSPKPEKVLFLPSGRDWELLSSVFYTSLNKYLCIRRLAGVRHISPAVLWTLWPDGGMEPLTSAPRSEFMTQSLVLSIDNSFFRYFLESLELFSWMICADSERYRNLMTGIFLKFKLFLATWRFHRSFYTSEYGF